MGRHVVSTLQSMLIFRSILRNESVENSLHIYADIRICIFIDAQSATRMLTE